MSFTYDFTNAPDLSRVRRIIGDTDSTEVIFQDDEINDALQMFSSQNIIVGLTGYALAVPVTQIYSWRRSAASLLQSISAVKARNLVTHLLDVTINGQAAAAALQKIAADLISQEELDGYFAVSEMVPDSFSMRERLRNQLYRTNNT